MDKFAGLIHILSNEATKSTMPMKLAAGLFYNRKGFIGTGYNSTRSYVQKKIQATLHAEDAAIHNVKTRYKRIKTKNLKLMVVRVDAKKQLVVSKPCLNCTHMIYDYGIRKVYYINDQNKLVCERIHSMISYHKQFPYYTQTNLWFHSVCKGNYPVLPFIIKVKETEKHIPLFTKEMGKRLIELRNERHMTSSEVAIKICIPIKQLQNIEQGKEPYNCKLYMKLQKIFGLFSW
jgi:deoxycytidylate deaminase